MIIIGSVKRRHQASYDHSLLDFKSAVQYMKHFIYHFTKRDMLLYTILGKHSGQKNNLLFVVIFLKFNDF